MMVRDKKRFQATLPYFALLMAIVLSAWLLDTVVATSIKPEAPTAIGSPQLMSTTSITGAFLPVLNADKTGRLLLAYNHNTSTIDTPSFNPYYRVSTNGGATWSAPKPIQLGSDNMLEVTFAFDNNNVAHAVWRTQYEIWHASENGWPAKANSHKIKSNTGAFVLSPDIAVAPDNTLHVVWAQENKIFHSYSKNGGVTWSTPLALSPGTGQLRSDVPDVEVDYQGNVHVVWEERISLIPPLKYEVHYKKGTVSSQGITWDPSYKILSPGIGVAKVPAMTIDGNIIHVAFTERITDEIQYAYYVKATLTSNWSAPLDITQGKPLIMNTNIPFVLMASLDACNQNLYVFFHGALEENHAERILRVDSGTNWSTRGNVTNGNNRAIRPSLTCVGGMLHAAYEVINIPNKNHQIYYVGERANDVYLPVLRSR